MSALLTAALEYAERDWPVFPCKPRRKDPLTPNGFKDATTDPDEIRRWWGQWPAANIGVPTGPGTFDALDIDGEAGFASLRELEARHDELPVGPRQVTGGGGQHCLFVGGSLGRCSASKLGNKIDVKSEGGYVVVAPSIHASGQAYVFEDLDDADIPAPPGWLVDLIQEARRPAPRANRVSASNTESIPEGQRNTTLFSIAASMRRPGMTAAEIRAALIEVNRSRCNPPLTEDEVRSIAESASRYSPESRFTGRIVLPKERHETGAAEAFADSFGSDFIWVIERKSWYVWDGRRWERDKGGHHASRALTELARACWLHAGDLMGGDDDAKKKAKEWFKLAVKLHTHRARTNILGLAQDQLARDAATLDVDPWLLNVANGTLDLRECVLRDHRREDYLTRLAEVEYDPEATSDDWDRFLASAIPNVELRAWLLRAAGMTLVGEALDRVLVLLYGAGRNGKGTFLDAIRGALGDYGATVGSEFFKPQNGPNDPALAELPGVRFVESNELPRGTRWATDQIKTLTGGDEVSACAKYERPFSFRPQFTLWVAANDRPRLPDDDQAVWDRMRLVPFGVRLYREGDAERDPQGAHEDRGLRTRLRTDPANQLAVLRSLVDGLREYHRVGLGTCQAIEEAGGAYRAEMNPVAEWVEERCEPAEGLTPFTADLYDDFVGWFKKHRPGEPVPTIKSFGARLTKLGVKQAGRSGSRPRRVGLKLRDDARSART